jgi:hypothetical protein
MRKIFFIIGFIITLATAAYSQGIVEDKVIKKIAELKIAGVDTIMVWQSFFPIVTNSDTSACYVYNNSRYLFWVHQRHNFIGYIDECYEYSIVKNKLDAVANLLTQHLSDITHQDIKPPAIKAIENGKEILNEVTTSDDAWFKYTFYIKGSSFVKSFSLSNLTTKDFQGNKNVYYDQNQQTYLKQIHDILMTTSPKLKFKKK